MTKESTGMNRIHKILIVLLLVNILGDVFNVIGWNADPAVTTTLAVPVYAGSITLAVVAAVFVVHNWYGIYLTKF